MKVAVDVTPILPGGEGGGAKQLVLELLKGLGMRQGSEKYILLTSDKNHNVFAEFEKLGMKRICIVRTEINTKPSIWNRILNRFKREFYTYRFPSILKREGVSLLFCPMTAPSFCEAGIPTVSLVYDLQHVFYPYFFTEEELAHRNNFYNQLENKADFIICISSFTRDTVIEKLQIPPERVISIPICVHNRLNRPGKDIMLDTLRKYKLQEMKYFIYPANFWPHKNHKMLLTAFNIFSHNCAEHDFHLVFTGATIDDNARVIEDAVKQMAIADKVHILGYLSEEELASIWSGAYSLIFPSLFEGFGIPLLEAMFFEKPILCSNSTSLPEVGGDAVIYFDPRRPDEIAAAMESILIDKRLYDTLVLKGKERIEKFSFEHMVDNYMSVFNDVSLVDNKKDYYDIHGIYGDGWAGKAILISFGASNSLRLMDLELFMPDWHPKLNGNIIVKFNGNNLKKYCINRGEIIKIQKELPQKGGSMQLDISSVFIPDNGDVRALTLMVNNLVIKDKEDFNNIIYNHGE